MSMRIKNILFPTDFSDVALVALQHARELADAFDARLSCLHVIDEAYLYWSSVGPESLPLGPPPEELNLLVEARMDRFAQEHLGGMKHPVKTKIATGRPFAEIIRYARENEIDLIVMATHGRGALAHVLLGSTTEKVVRKASCAVLTVRADDHEFVMP